MKYFLNGGGRIMGLLGNDNIYELFFNKATGKSVYWDGKKYMPIYDESGGGGGETRPAEHYTLENVSRARLLHFDIPRTGKTNDIVMTVCVQYARSEYYSPTVYMVSWSHSDIDYTSGSWHVLQFGSIESNNPKPFAIMAERDANDECYVSFDIYGDFTSWEGGVNVSVVKEFGNVPLEGQEIVDEIPEEQNDYGFPMELDVVAPQNTAGIVANLQRYLPGLYSQYVSGGNKNFRLGQNSNTSLNGSVAIGHDAKANGAYAAAFGIGATTTHTHGIAIGEGSGTRKDFQAVLGNWQEKTLTLGETDVVGDIYSTTETPTGNRWIDGKPIYRKCFYADGNSVNVNGSTAKNFDPFDGNPEYETITNAFVFAKCGGFNGVGRLSRIVGEDGGGAGYDYWEAVFDQSVDGADTNGSYNHLEYISGWVEYTKQYE
jgi:hypothetical protein